MDQTLSKFIAALRNSNIRVSTAETLDAFKAVELVGYSDRALLKHTLNLVLPKTCDEKDVFTECFDRFFSFEEVSSQSLAGEGGELGDAQNGDGDAAGSGGDGNQPGEGGSGGGGGENTGDGESQELEPIPPGNLSEASSALGQLLMRNDRAELTVQMARAGEEAQVETIKVFTQKGLYTRRILEGMGLSHLIREIVDKEKSEHLPDRRLSRELKLRQDILREQVRDYVERQFLLHADHTGMRLREELLRKVKLSNVEHRNFRVIQEIVLRMAKKLVSLHSQRRRVLKRGQLHVPRTLRKNMSYDGAIFDLRWKSTKVDRPNVFAICDVSGSVANYSRFLLMFLYSLEEVMSKVRCFAFSSDLGEVSEMFDRYPMEEAITRTLHHYSTGSTDYGQALQDFKKLCMDDVNKRSTIIILGDSRNNYCDAHAEILKEMYDKSKRVIWLNPEARNTWNTGDAIMRKYAPYCHQVEECNSLVHLERTVGNLLLRV
ncbi:MAG: VWA domain-containing protein [Pseudomonadales bacterium]|nr:VWA domain-containing protein [Pseudomonadales bacterium]